MARRKRDPRDTYVEVEVFACGEGHFLTPGFTHWEQGEVCIFDHEPSASNHDVHMYYRKLWVPTHIGTKEDPYTKDSPTYQEHWAANPGKWGHAYVL